MTVKASDLLTPPQLADLLNWISGAKEIWAVQVPLVTSWNLIQRRAIEAWCDNQLRLARIIPQLERKNGRGRLPNDKLPPELERFQVFRSQWWMRAQRWYEKSA
jgi:hypothetical protein